MSLFGDVLDTIVPGASEVIQGLEWTINAVEGGGPLETALEGQAGSALAAVTSAWDQVRQWFKYGAPAHRDSVRTIERHLGGLG